MRILVIDDETKIVNLIRKSLSLEGFDVDFAYDGEVGLNMAKQRIYDLIVLDVMLPKMDGLAVCKSLRAEDNCVPVIMLTARDAQKDKAKGIRAGANEYMVKPFALSELSLKINKLLENKKKIVSYSGEERRSPGRRARDLENEKLNKLHQKILDNAPISIVTIDKNGNMTSANEYYRNLSKYEDFRKNNVLTGKFFIRENLVKDYKKLLKKGISFNRENCFERNVNGENKYLKITAVPLRDENGNIEGGLSMAVDNTEAVLFKNKLQELNNKLEKKIKKRTAELDRVNEQLVSVLERKSNFMADVSHEMRTSLAIIQGNLELVAKQFNIAEAANSESESFDQMFDEIKRMSAMLSDLSLLANSDSSKQELVFNKVNLNEKILATCKSLKLFADEKNISINYAGQKKIEIVADENKIEKLLFNLLNNAIKYNVQNGWISIGVKQLKKEVVLTIEDGGIGIAKKHLPYVFERFYRADTSGSRKRGGTGLGLAICKWVANAHNGNIEVESILGEGSIFVVRLPLRSV